MEFWDVVLLLIVAGICGSLAEMLVGYSHGGCLASIAIGFVGALIGFFIADLLAFPVVFAIDIGGRMFPVVWAVIGGVIFVGILSLLRRRRPSTNAADT